jgi:hypothetical protein
MYIKNEKLRKALKIILAIPVFLWVGISMGLFYLGSGIRWVGNWMTDFKLDNSIGSVHFE